MTGTPWLILLLQALAIVVILAEFLIPSMGVLTVVSLCLFGYSIYRAFSAVSPMAGTVVLIGDILLAPVLIMVGLRLLGSTSITLKHTLSSSNGAVSQRAELDLLIGATGPAATDLRPSGMARINGQRVDVVTGGGYVEAGTTVRVRAVEGNQVIVAPVENDGDVTDAVVQNSQDK